jgi:hypothetical protein
LYSSVQNHSKSYDLGSDVACAYSRKSYGLDSNVAYPMI